VLYELERRADLAELDRGERVLLKDEQRVLGSGVLSHLAPGLAPTLADLGTLMMMVSDNTAANLLIERLGVTEINAAIRAAGLTRLSYAERSTSARSPPAGAWCPLPASCAVLLRLRHGDCWATGGLRFFDVLHQKYIEPIWLRPPILRARIRRSGAGGWRARPRAFQAPLRVRAGPGGPSGRSRS
jgi:hypothetical protein